MKYLILFFSLTIPLVTSPAHVSPWENQKTTMRAQIETCGPHEKKSRARAALDEAVKHRDLAFASYTLDRGADPNKYETCLTHPLVHASHASLAYLLLRHGADPMMMTNEFFPTPLFQHTLLRDPRLALLYSPFSDPLKHNNRSQSPIASQLINCCGAPQETTLMRYLVYVGVPLNSKDDYWKNLEKICIDYPYVWNIGGQPIAPPYDERIKEVQHILSKHKKTLEEAEQDLKTAQQCFEAQTVDLRAVLPAPLMQLIQEYYGPVMPTQAIRDYEEMIEQAKKDIKSGWVSTLALASDQSKQDQEKRPQSVVQQDRPKGRCLIQ